VGLGGSFDILSKKAIQMHGSSQLIGWVGLYIMGFFYFILPRLKGTTLLVGKWANLSYYLVLFGLITRALFYVLEKIRYTSLSLCRWAP
jgi:heme/copper-type cytochrome/quinol oxidase subunit 1